MPGLNRKGPLDKGPMTGRKMGQCNPENRGKTEDEIMQNRIPESSELNKTMGWGLGRGCGRGLGLGRGRFRGNA